MEGEAAAAVLQVLVQNLIDHSKKEISLIRGLDKDAAKLTGSLDTIQKFLNDAEQRAIPGEAVKSWLKRLEDVAFDADNVLDELNYRILSKEINYKATKSMKEKVLSCFSSFSHIARPRNMALRIKEIYESLDSINKEATELGLVGRLANEPTLVITALETDSYTLDPIFIGRDDVESEIVEMLTNSITTDEGSVSILAIVGMGGLGKTTLTRKVFNRLKNETRFGSHIWVHVSPSFDPIILFKKILKELTSTDGVGVEVESKQDILSKLQKAFKDKTYLLILDDIWNEDLSKWEYFINSLLGVTSIKGNAIVVTTRSMKVASIVNPLHTHELEGLSAEHCWSIMKEKTFGKKDVPSEFEAIGRKIARRCQGLPLAANVVGGILSNQSEEKWRSIEEKWLSPDEGGDNITKILRLSYDNLSPSLLKKCFAYCAMFPKGSEIRKRELIEMWMAEGFLQVDERDDMESVGEKFINVLLHNSLLQVSKRDHDGNVKKCGMHDLVHDLACSVSTSSSNTCGSSRVRYMSLKEKSSEGKSKEMAKYLRTLLISFYGGRSLINFSDLESLHVLRLDEGVEELSRSIRKLIHLRYFDISHTRIVYLPDWIGKFFHLQTFRVDAPYLTELPSTIKYLINLRHLYINERAELPIGIGRLTSLQTLKYFPVGDENGCKIEELGSLNNLKGELNIRNLERVHDKEEAGKANLFKKSKIWKLCLKWDEDREGETNDENVLEGLQPHPNLKVLEIFGFNGKRFPLWTQKMAVRDQDSWVVLNKLTTLTLCYCFEFEEMPMLGHLPSLKYLVLAGLYNLKCMNSSFYGMVNKDTRVVFPALELLILQRMPKLAKWAEIEIPGGSEVKVFPRLQHLQIESCVQLVSVPTDLLFNQALSDLEIRECPNLRELSDSRGEQSQGRSFTSLRNLWIRECEALEYLPCEMLGFSLEELSLKNLSSLKNLPRVIACLPNLPRLTHLTIEGVPNFMTTCRLEISPFPSLRGMSIDASTGDSSSMETVDAILQGCCHSLNDLSLKGMESWECLPESIQHLTALSKLKLDNFGMEELPEWFASLSSLEHLSLCNCKRLRRLPSMDAMRRLTTLRFLEIKGCPELVIKSEATDSEWPKVSYIHSIGIDGSYITRDG
ncbi:putative disease resistance protein RGA3 isoform X2 [Salvia miltiorrhiza]|uniref:putative disease resistance protein RGA3 isoform X2 n=1 Tax=Salvia miltiorrhiza TaxID=226208 RepID=UPI0025AD54F9|nr:putative disease resistance protein RGA3 isoform X2 [Salvia miltiorrhiza]XP_057781517.1 putative disease resistance protein RGA3 isoform X2 [Salvia miltiorrhiza]